MLYARRYTSEAREPPALLWETACSYRSVSLDTPYISPLTFYGDVKMRHGMYLVIF